MAISAGDKAPDFTLTSFTPSDEPVDISLNSFKGNKNVLIFFFPQAFTGVCSDEMVQIVRDYDKLNRDDTQILGISVDGTFVQKEFAKQNNVKFPLLSDFNKEVINRYDVVQAEFAHGMKEVSKRSVFLIGKDGLVKYTETTENPGVQVNFDKLKEAMKSLS